MSKKKILALVLYPLVCFALLYLEPAPAQPAEGGGGEQQPAEGCDKSKVNLIVSYGWPSDNFRWRIEEKFARTPTIALTAILKKVLAIELTGAPLKPGEAGGPHLEANRPPIGVSVRDLEPTDRNIKIRIAEAAKQGRKLTEEEAYFELRYEYLTTVLRDQFVRNCQRNGEKAAILLSEDDYRDWLASLKYGRLDIEALVKAASSKVDGLQVDRLVTTGSRKGYLVYDPNCFTDPCGPADRGVLALFRKIASIEGYGTWLAALLDALAKAAAVNPNLATEAQLMAALGHATAVAASRKLDLVSLSHWVRFGMVTATKLRASVYRNPDLPADTNGDGIVTTTDFAAVLPHIGKVLPGLERNALGYFPDVDGNRRVDAMDALLLTQALRAQLK